MRFNKRVEIYVSTKTPDGFGGFTTIVSLLGEYWCELISMNENKQSFQELGLNDYGLVYSLKMRDNGQQIDPKTCFVQYVGQKYSIISSVQNPNATNSYLKFIIKKQV